MISWYDDDLGKFNTVWVESTTQLRYWSERSEYAWFRPFDLGTSILVGRDGNGDLMYACVTEVVDCDTDGDGLLDSVDSCDSSIRTDTVLVGGCDTGVSNPLDEQGCTLADKLGLDAVLAAAARDAKNHGAVVRSVAKHLNGAVEAGLITWEEHEAIMSCVGASKLP